MTRSQGSITISDARLPIVDVVYEGEPAADEYRRAFAEYARIASAGTPVAYLIDMRTFDPLGITADKRRAASEVFKQYEHRLAAVSVAEARVITSPITRGIVTAFDWLTSANKWPCRQFASRDEGERWLREQLSARPRR
ncbi:MAG: hypothetical protein M3Y87_26330 [Myxococcota bacterium]|nr:hypothetical protein [Myxococcota bacterium]